MGVYRKLRKDFDRDLPQIRKIILDLSEDSGMSVEVSSDHDDVHNCSDITIIRPGKRSLHVGVRGRKFEDSHYNDFLLRFKVISGRKTEIQKIMEGKGDLFLYYFRHSDKKTVWTYRMINLRKFREYLYPFYLLNSALPKFQTIDNNDGSEGKAFCWDYIPKDVIMYSQTTEKIGGEFVNGWGHDLEQNGN